MNRLATITSKKQLTIPVGIFKRMGLKIGQKVLVSEDKGHLLITPAERLVEELAGILTMPKKWKSKNLDQVIEDSKKEYFRNHKK